MYLCSILLSVSQLLFYFNEIHEKSGHFSLKLILHLTGKIVCVLKVSKTIVRSICLEKNLCPMDIISKKQNVSTIVIP